MKPLTLRRLAAVNLRRRALRTGCLVALAAAFACTLFGGAILTRSLNNGVVQLSKRLGADILAVPTGYTAAYEGALLRGEPSSFYFNASFAEKLRTVPGVTAASAQLYIATLSASCCAYPLQIIGFAEETDFAVRPWLSAALKKPLGDEEIIVGHNIQAKAGQTLRFFGRDYKVAARLDETGMGFDTSVFMNLPTARRTAQIARRGAQHPAAKEEDLISSVVLKIENGRRVKDVANAILQAFALEGVSVVVTKDLVSGTAGAFAGLSAYIYILAGVLWVLAAAALILVFCLSVNERRREFGAYRVAGAPKSFVRRLIFCEALRIGCLGAAVGLALAAVIVFPMNGYIRSLFALPFLQPPLAEIFLIAAAVFAAALALGPLAALFAVIRADKLDINSNLREDG